MVVVVRIFLVIVLIALGYFGYSHIAGMARPPAGADAAETALPVSGVTLRSGDEQVTLSGYGRARARTRVALSPEVSGRVVEVHPRLESGEVIAAGETLFVIDPRTYELRLAQADAEIERLRAETARIAQSEKNDARRLALSRRARDLAKSEYERASTLFEEKEVGSLSTVEMLEKNLTLAEDQVAAIENALALYPITQKEIEAALKAGEVARDSAALDLERTCVKAPFAARLEHVALELNQVVSPASQVMTLVDDALLEIPVPLDSREMSRWFPFDGESAPEDWFAPLPGAVSPTVSWTENPESFSWKGTLSRIERFNATTNTAVVVVAVDNAAASGSRLVEGMFCTVAIPGRTARNVFRVPADAVSHENTVFLAEPESSPAGQDRSPAGQDGSPAGSDRLRTVAVEVVHREGSAALIRGDIANGSVLITTRIAAPLENMLLAVTLDEPGADGTE